MAFKYLKMKKMKNKIKPALVVLSLFILSGSFAQLKVINNGYVAIGINYPNYPFHVYGWAQLFNDNGMEIKFRPNNGQQSEIGSNNSGHINFWNTNCYANGGWNKLKANQYLTISDQKYKQNIQSMTNNLAMIKQLQPKQYTFIDSIVTAETGRLRYGFIAQDVLQTLPSLVDTTRGAYAIDYSEVIPFLVGAVKEQAATIDSLRSSMGNSGGRMVNNNNNSNQIETMQQQIRDLQTKLSYFENNCCASLNSNPGTELNSQVNNDNLLLQNVPNPFQSTTTIKFNIPAKYSGNFFIRIYKISGEELISQKVNKEDKEIILDASSLVNGVYNYALIANSDILLMKQMIINK
jgi:hypothetical protein